MATKTISITEEVYHELVKIKRGEESFSEELARIIHGKGKISECAGLWSWMTTEEANSIEEAIEKRRRLSEIAKREKRKLA